MNERPRFFDDLAGMAGGAMSALTGLRDEAEAMVKARVEEAIRKLDLVKREQLDAMADVATRAREGQIALEARVTALEALLRAQAAPDHAAPEPAFEVAPADAAPPVHPIVSPRDPDGKDVPVPEPFDPGTAGP